MAYDVTFLTTDGSSLGNPGPGGWACYIQKFASLSKSVKNRMLSGSIPKTTNNLAELEAIYQGLLRVTIRGSYVEIHSDSINVIGWVYGWNTYTLEPDFMHRFKRRNPAIHQATSKITSLVNSMGLVIDFRKVDETDTILNLVDKEAKRVARAGQIALRLGRD